MFGHRRYAVGISYARAYRATVEPVAQALAVELGGKERILFDGFRDWNDARFDLDRELLPLYLDACELIVVFLSPEYGKGEWCQREWQHIHRRIGLRRRHVMLLAFGDPKENGLELPPGCGCLDVTKLSPADIAGSIVKRYRATVAELRAQWRAMARRGAGAMVLLPVLLWIVSGQISCGLGGCTTTTTTVSSTTSSTTTSTTTSSTTTTAVMCAHPGMMEINELPDEPSKEGAKARVGRYCPDAFAPSDERCRIDGCCRVRLPSSPERPNEIREVLCARQK